MPDAEPAFRSGIAAEDPRPVGDRGVAHGLSAEIAENGAIRSGCGVHRPPDQLAIPQNTKTSCELGVGGVGGHQPGAIRNLAEAIDLHIPKLLDHGVGRRDQRCHVARDQRVADP